MSKRWVGLVVQFIAGTAAGWAVGFFIYSKYTAIPSLTAGNVKYFVNWLVVPLVSSAVILLMDKTLLGSRRYDLMCVCKGLVYGIVSVMVIEFFLPGAKITDAGGIAAVYWDLIVFATVAAVFSLLGYNSVYVQGKRRKKH